MRILIVGLGAAGQRHARNLRALLGERLELAALRRRGTGFALTERLEVEEGVTPESRLNLTAFRRWGDALAWRPDAAVIANPTSLHLEAARRLAACGCGLLIEKPLSHAWRGVPAFAAAVRRRGQPCLVGYPWRFHPLLERVRSLLAARPFGRLVAASATYGEYLPGWHPYEDYRASYAARRELGGGVLLTQIHEFDYLGWLLGWPDRVFSVGGRLGSLELDVEDTASTLWRVPVDGRPIPVHVHLDYLRRPPVRRCEFLAEDGRFACDLLEARLTGWDASGRRALDESFQSFRRNDMFLAELRHFLACLDGKETPSVPAEEGARSLAMALAARRSLVSGRVERVAGPLLPDQETGG
jgi:predicted dehydrogenase